MQEKEPLLTIDEARARGLWFVSKRFGYGWFPITWQGWLVVLVYVLLEVLLVLSLRINNPYPTGSQILMVVIGFIVLTAIEFTICLKKGEKARWRWGK